MKFGSVALNDALGAILAHSVEGRVAGRAKVFRKGTVLAAEHLEAFAAASLAEVVVACLEPGDIEENAAALALARALVADGASQGLRLTAAGAGRVNLFATTPGVLTLNAEAVAEVNLVTSGITLATLPEWARVADGTMVATIKIIPYGVEADLLLRCEDLAREAASLSIASPKYRTASLIETSVGDRAPSDKGRKALRVRLDRLGVELSPRIVVPHETRAIAQSVTQVPGEVVFLLTASATSDIQDVAPQGVRQAGGTICHYGLPVDPGNLLFLGQIGVRPVIGLPGCARSPALNGADWVMERVICGHPPGPAGIAAMGVGGLLKESPARPHPRKSL